MIYADLVADGSGGAVVAWQDGRPGAVWDIYAQRLSALGAQRWAPSGNPVCTAAGDQKNISMVADGAGGAIVTWEDHAVAWDIAHDEGTEGSHHARIAKFLREYKVEAVVTGHLGDGMVRMLGTMGIAANLGMTGDAKAAAVAAAR